MLYDNAQMAEPDFTDQEIAVYSGTAVISGEQKDGVDGIVLIYQACDERRCLPPARIQVKVTTAE
jgi:hypothetical protein